MVRNTAVMEGKKAKKGQNGSFPVSREALGEKKKSDCSSSKKEAGGRGSSGKKTPRELYFREVLGEEKAHATILDPRARVFYHVTTATR